MRGAAAQTRRAGDFGAEGFEDADLEEAARCLLAEIMTLPGFAAVPAVPSGAEPPAAAALLEIERWPSFARKAGLASVSVTAPASERDEAESRRRMYEDSLPAAAQPFLEALPQDAALKRVLIVDDNADYRDALRLLLLQMGYEVYTGEDGVRGMELVRETQPHLIITDFNMPRMNGYELVVALRSNPETIGIPIVLFTGAANQRQLAGIDLGVCRFLEKPFPNEMLLGIVSDFIGEGGEGAAGLPAPAPAAPRKPAPLITAEETRAAAELLIDEAPQEAPEETTLDDDASDSPLIARVHKILAHAVELGASDIHFEPREKEVAVRFRIDGGLMSAGSLPASVKNRLATRLKIMAKLVITERRRPQDGQIRATVDGRKVEFRLSTIPGIFGESVVLRILGAAALKSSLGELGLSGRDQECLERAIQATHGLILVTGPTGSGKSTTLYTVMNVLNTPDVKILTAEDPVEYEMAGITQVAARPAIGLTFEAILRSFMRQDPDIMLVGEIRDLETADTAIKASITGHLVFSTLHTNSAPGTVARLIQMGVPPYLIAASVRLVVAQRLVRLICQQCKTETELSESDRRFLLEPESRRLERVFFGAGCEACGHRGYQGRMPLFEVMPVQSARMRQSIQNADKADLISELAMLEGMKTLREAALAAVVAGQTSFQEAMNLIVGA